MKQEKGRNKSAKIEKSGEEQNWSIFLGNECEIAQIRERGSVNEDIYDLIIGWWY